MNIALWIAQMLLAAMYLMVGSTKVFQPARVRENPRMPGRTDSRKITSEIADAFIRQ